MTKKVKKEPMKGTVYLVDGTTEEVTPKNGFDFTLKELQEIVDGYIEVVPLMGTDNVAVCNEEGKIIGLAYNERVNNEHWVKSFPHTLDFLVGNVLICNRKMIK